MASILSEYFRFFNEYSGKYGSNVAVLMQVGSFYEMYGVNNGNSRLGNAEELSRILNIVLTRRNKKLPADGFNNPLMLGFPCLALGKYMPVLLDEDYTVVVVDQVKTALSIKRAVVDVVSPSINMDDGPAGPAGPGDNYLVLVHSDKHGHVGMSAISVMTGNSIVHECYSDPNDTDRPIDDALGFMKQYRPREVVLSGEHMPSLRSHLELDDVLCHTSNTCPRRRLSVEYQDSVLGLAFDNSSHGILSNIEHLGLEKTPYALLSYVLLIEFVYDHNPMLLRRMSPPDTFLTLNRLVLSTNTVDQLNIAGMSSRGRASREHASNTLFGVVNRCSTNAGKRLLMRRILAPAVDAAEIERRYSQVDEFGEFLSNDIKIVEGILSKVADIERLQRRMSVGIMTPSELAGMCLSYEAVAELDNVLRGIVCSSGKHARGLSGLFMSDSHKAALDEFVGMCRYAFDIDSMLTSDVIFNVGVFEDIDRLKGAVQREMDKIRDFAFSIGIDTPRIEHTSSIGHYITVTSSQAKVIKLSHGTNVMVRSNSASSRVTSPKIEAASRRIASLSEALKARTQRHYRATLECLLSYSNVFNPVVRFVSSIDIVKSNHTTGKLYNYCRPVVVTEGTSFVDAKGLRHPIIERIDDGNGYVPNDVSLGKDHNGIVLYSMNSCGKTSLLRALGLSVVLAQAGCFVPASCFTIRPFRCMMTRILSKDNIMKGQSSFVAEMAELRAILKRATDSSTLVLADEITHGTEHTSGSSIFVSSVETLAKRGANFMFTTHLHNVHPFVRAVPNVAVFHLSVVFVDGKVVFERKLRGGPGGSIYGLEVCELLGMDTEFIARAFQVRAMITPDKADKATTAKPKPSRYNNKKVVRKCESCGYSPRLPTDSPLDTHHVRHQALADKNGMINGVHKDALSNLTVLCKQCHSREHYAH
jgi:DNA mismatch repair protein MutS